MPLCVQHSRGKSKVSVDCRYIQSFCLYPITTGDLGVSEVALPATEGKGLNVNLCRVYYNLLNINSSSLEVILLQLVRSQGTTRERERERERER